MGLLDKLKQAFTSQPTQSVIPSIDIKVSYTSPSQPSEESIPDLPPVGNPEPICPYCNSQLDKMLGRKKKCPSCSNFIFVRTRPSDRQKVLVTEEQAQEIEEQWAIVSGTHDEYLADREAFEAERTILATKFGHQPSDDDVTWSLLNKDLLTHASNGDWGLYTNTKLRMADLLKKGSRFEQALSTYLEICYLDLNGPRNCSGIKDSDILAEYPPFSQEEGFLAPGVVSYASALMSKLQFDIKQTRELYTKVAEIQHRNLKLPLPPEVAWKNIETELLK